ncbi:MAG: ferredoxin--NADP reductase [Candidatus Kapaibacterium sp.]
MEKDAYNATVTGKIMITPDLMVLRVRTDSPRVRFEAGQYTTIGCYAEEPRSANSVMPVEEMPPDHLIKRPYSIASANHETQNFEFYISQVKSGQLTPRLFNLTQGRRMWVDDDILGVFNLNETPEGKNIVMIATGTGLAPYISFLRSHMKDHHDIKLVVIHGAAYPWDLGYLSELEFIENAFPNFYYFPTLLKADEKWHGLRGYIEKHLEAGILQNDAGVELDPDKTHFYLCGNPKMVDSVSGFLNQYGYTKHGPNEPGALHVEEY